MKNINFQDNYRSDIILLNQIKLNRKKTERSCKIYTLKCILIVKNSKYR